MADINHDAARAGMNQREWLIWILAAQFKKGVEYGDEQAGAEGDGGSNHGEGAVNGGRDGGIRESGEKSGRLPTPERRKRVKGLRSMRGGVHGQASNEGFSGVIGPGAVLRSHDDAQPESSAVGGGSSKDFGGKRASERVYLGPPHRKGCGCKSCKEAK